MEEELKCSLCKQYFNQPVLLPCFHAVCLACALQNQQPVNLSSLPNNNAPNSCSSVSELSELSCSNTDCNDSDKLSILSETDSGVVVSSSSITSRPSSYIGTTINTQPTTAVAGAHLHINTTGSNNHSASAASTTFFFSLACPSCRKVVYFDENGAQNLPRYRAMQTIVDKFIETKTLGQYCQLCEPSHPQAPHTSQKEASVFCEQCEVFYCETCRDHCHPARGPLAKHTLMSAQQGRAAIRAVKEKLKMQQQQANGTIDINQRCVEHADQMQSYFCSVCKMGVCTLCVHDGRHIGHEVHLLTAVCKQQKAELTQSLQQLSEKAKNATEVMQRLKSSTEQVHESCSQVEGTIHAQCAELINALRRREEALIEFARRERDLQLKRLREEVATCTAHLQHTTALVQFCIEAVKETDPFAFLQIGSMLVNRVSNLDLTWRQEIDELTSRPNPTLELTLDDLGLRRSIEQLTFLEMKPPGPPVILAEECSAENNSITVAWQQHPASFVEGFVLELDDGSNGPFREVYCGKENICTVDGLHFNSLYNARVKAFNSSGEGPYSESLGLHTAEVAWFTFDMVSCPPEARLSPDGLTATTDSYEPRVLLGSVGFSRGVHYWEFTVERYDGTADPAFGIARRDVTREFMLGKDDKGWSMYIDHQRSWLLHNNVHSNRADGGIDVGSTVGILLDLDRRQLTFYVNDESQGTVAFTDLCGVFYPAVSLNRNVAVTLHSALDPPSSCPDSGEESDDMLNTTTAGDAVSDRTVTTLTSAIAAL